MNTLSHRHNVAILIGLSTLAIIVSVWGYLLWNPATPKPVVSTEQETLTLTAPIIGGSDPVRGIKTADVTIVEFGDFLCPSCADMHETLTGIMKKNPRVRLIWKDMPNITAHPFAREAAIAAHCALEQNKFWEYHDLLFSKQDEITGVASFDDFANQLALNVDTFTQCRSSTDVAQAVDLTTAEGLALGVNATPYFFIGTERGNFTQSTLAAIIETATLSKQSTR